MRKPMVVSIVTLSLLLVLGIGYIALNKNHPKNSATSTAKTTAAPTTSSKDNAAATDQHTFPTSITGFAFADPSITVKKGTTVTWTNKDSTAHTVTESDGQTGPDSGSLAPDKSYSFTYNTVGTFKYRCTFHASMTGVVTVTE